MPFGISWPEILILLLVALLVFGPKRLPEMGRSLGRGFREFKDSITGKDEPDEEQRAAELPPSREESAVKASTRERDTVS
jgi:sec-independent protein translocase protein TatA